MKKIIFKLPLIALFASFNAFATPQQPINGGTGVSNDNANIISLGGPVLTSGSFTLSGAFSTTLVISANTVVTLPSGTHTLASNDGSNATGTWAINITGSAAGGASPTGSAGGVLTGSYPNPGLANGIIIPGASGRDTTFTLDLGDSSYSALTEYTYMGTPYWSAGLTQIATGFEYGIFNFMASSYPFYIDYASNIVTIENLAVGSVSDDQLIGVDLDQNLISGNLSGDVASSRFITTLATVNSSPGTTGSSSVVPVITYNGKGLVTSVSSATITPAAIGAPTDSGTGASGTWGINITGTSTGAPPTGTAGGDLIGAYPNPSINNNAVTYSKFQQVFSDRLLGNPTGSLANASEIGLGFTLSFSGSTLETNALTGDVTSLANSFATTVAQINGAPLGVTTPTAGYLLIGSGTQWNSNPMTGDVGINSGGGTTIASNAVTNAKFRQSAAESLVGNSTGSTANVADISASANNQVMRSSGGALGFGSIDISQSNTVGSSVLGQSNGGTNNSSGYGANQICFQNSGNTAFSSTSEFKYTASSGTMVLSSAQSAPSITVGTTLTGSQNSATFIASRGDTANGAAAINFDNGATTIWGFQMFSTAAAMSANSNDLIFRAAALGGGIGSVLGLGQTTGDITDFQGNLIIGTNGKTLEFPLADNDKILMYNTTNDSKIDTAGSWNFNFRSGSLAANNTGLFNWYTSGPSGAWVNQMSLSNGGNLTLNNGGVIIATANQGITIKSAAVSAGTANAAIITGVTLAGGTVTVNDSYVNTSTVCSFSVVTASGTIATGGYKVTVGSGTVTVAGGSLDTSSGNLACLKGN